MSKTYEQERDDLCELETGDYCYRFINGYDAGHARAQAQLSKLEGVEQSLQLATDLYKSAQARIADLDQKQQYDLEVINGQVALKDLHIAELEKFIKDFELTSSYKINELQAERDAQIKKNYELCCEYTGNIPIADVKPLVSAALKVQKFGYGENIEKNCVITNTGELLDDALQAFREKHKGVV